MPTTSTPEYTIIFSRARQGRGMKPFGLFREEAAGLFRCVSDHQTRAHAEAACRKLGGKLVRASDMLTRLLTSEAA